VRREAKVRDLQNRLGFTIGLARKVAEQKQQLEVAFQLAQQEGALRGSRVISSSWIVRLATDQLVYEARSSAEGRVLWFTSILA
jgi:hypothetical protein